MATAAPNGSIGLFFKRDSDLICSFRIHADFTLDRPKRSGDGRGYKMTTEQYSGIYTLFPRDDWLQDLEHGKLNQRAWVVQERFLSTRIMHFSASQVFWECLENRSSEAFPISVPELALPFWFEDSVRLKRIFFGTREGKTWRDELYEAWQILLEIIQDAGCQRRTTY